MRRWESEVTLTWLDWSQAEWEVTRTIGSAPYQWRLTYIEIDTDTLQNPNRVLTLKHRVGFIDRINHLDVQSVHFSCLIGAYERVYQRQEFPTIIQLFVEEQKNKKWTWNSPNISLMIIEGFERCRWSSDQFQGSTQKKLPGASGIVLQLRL